MRILFMPLFMAGLLATIGAPLFAQSPADEEAAIRRALDHYLQGHATGDGDHFRAVFHPQSNLYSVRDGALVVRTSEAYAAGAPGRPPADEAERRRRIVSIDVAGTAAMARIELDYPTVRFIDYMSLLKIDGEWKIIAKIFHAEAKPR